MTTARRFLLQLCVWLTLSCDVSVAIANTGGTLLMDTSGALQVQSIPSSVTTSSGVVAVVTSPGTPSFLEEDGDSNEDTKNDPCLLKLQSENPPHLVCRGAALGITSSLERTSLATCSLVAHALVVDGVTGGDIESGFSNSRHGRTLTAIFRARVYSDGGDMRKQTLILAVGADQKDIDQDTVEEEVRALYEAAALEKKDSAAFENLYELQVLSANENSEIMTMAMDAASKVESSSPTSTSLAIALSEAHNQVKSSGMAAVGLDTPGVASAFIAVGTAFDRQALRIRAQKASWKSRIASGLVVDRFGAQATNLLKECSKDFDAATLVGAGMVAVASYRQKMRLQLQAMAEAAIEDAFEGQLTNLEKSTLKRFRSKLLKTLDDPAESLMESNAETLRTAQLTFDTVMHDLAVPTLGLTQEKASRIMSSKLNDELLAFPDSALAKAKRVKKFQQIVKKDKKPKKGQAGPPAVGLGLDFVAMFRPSGYGNLQGFCNYQLAGGHSITVGIQNDADDSQVIAQFGGIRPPFLRMQPKLRVDVEM